VFVNEVVISLMQERHDSLGGTNRVTINLKIDHVYVQCPHPVLACPTHLFLPISPQKEKKKKHGIVRIRMQSEINELIIRFIPPLCISPFDFYSSFLYTVHVFSTGLSIDISFIPFFVHQH
jgi:hypothetical protein